MTFKLLGERHSSGDVDFYLLAMHLHSSTSAVFPRFWTDKLNTNLGHFHVSSTEKRLC